MSEQATSEDAREATGPGPAARAARRRRLLVPVISLSGSLVLLVLLGIVLWTAARPVEPTESGSVRFGAPTPDRPLPYRTVQPGTRAAPLRLTGLDGRPVDLAAYRGRPVVVNFWASWCEPCKRELPLLAEARARHAGDGLVVLGVAVRDEAGSARAMAARYRVDWPLALDADDRVAGAWQVAIVPQTFFIRRDGTVASQQPGELGREGLDGQLRAIVAQP
jgi:cytochrome c biogenesis protein CcmG/thiol:disulfide interchange protein DsbE